jgi:prevent-host-death family protein
MTTVSVTAFKEHLAKYLREVGRGAEIQIVSHGRPVARLVGIRGTGHDERRDRLIAAGVLRAGSGAALPDEPLEVPGVDLSSALMDERGDRV